MVKLFCMVLLAWFVFQANAQRLTRNGQYFERENWANLKNLLDTPKEEKLNVFVVLTNSKVAKQHADYVRYVIHNFQHAGYVFGAVKEKFNLDQTKKEYLFLGIENSKDVMLYLQQRLNHQDNEILKQWVREKPVFVLHMTNQNEVKLMNNLDNQNHYLILTFIERQTKLPVVKFAKQMNSFNDISVSSLNMAMVITCLGFFVVGTRKNIFRVRQVATIPIFLFPAGHVYNQIHGNDGGQVTWLGVPFSFNYNGQTLAESYFIFVLYVAFAIGMFYTVQVSKKNKTYCDNKKVPIRKRANRKAAIRAQPQSKCTTDTSETGDCDHIRWAFLSVGIVSFLMLYKSYSLKL